MKAIVYHTLHEDVMKIREEVFIREQGFCNEIDSIDNNTATYVVLYDEAKPVATGRYFVQDDSYVIGRFAVLKEYRGKHAGAELLKCIEAEIQKEHGTRIKLHSQCDKKDFYRKQGYEARGEIEYEEDCPHVWMYKEI